MRHSKVRDSPPVRLKSEREGIANALFVISVDRDSACRRRILPA